MGKLNLKRKRAGEKKKSKDRRENGIKGHPMGGKGGKRQVPPPSRRKKTYLLAQEINRKKEKFLTSGKEGEPRKA